MKKTILWVKSGNIYSCTEEGKILTTFDRYIDDDSAWEAAKKVADSANPKLEVRWRDPSDGKIYTYTGV